MKRRTIILTGLVFTLGLLLSACGATPEATTETSPKVETVEQVTAESEAAAETLVESTQQSLTEERAGPEPSPIVEPSEEEDVDPTETNDSAEEAEIIISRVSIASDGAEANDLSRLPAISADGRYVAFESRASNLVEDDSNGVLDIFVHDRETAETVRVSVTSDGTEANDESFKPSISSDGRFVTFVSRASNLVQADTNQEADVFFHDRQSGETSLISIGPDGAAGNGRSHTADISADGNYIALVSDADNLVSGDTNGAWDVFVYDRQAEQMSLVSVNSAGKQGNQGESRAPTISADGRYVAFVSDATNLVEGDTNDKRDVFVHDQESGKTTRVSVASDGAGANDDSQNPTISADGRYVAFESWANNLVADDPNYQPDVFLHDRETGETIRVSAKLDLLEQESEVGADSPTISADGRYIVFSGLPLYVYDHQAGETFRLDEASLTSDAVLSDDGQYLAYMSRSGRLVEADTNDARDIFVQEIAPALEPLGDLIAEQTEEEEESDTEAASPAPSVEINKILADLTAGLPDGLPQLPVPESVEIEDFDGFIAIGYVTGSDLDQIADFYLAALPAHGWTVELEGYVDGNPSLKFARDKIDLDVWVEETDTGQVEVGLTVDPRIEQEILEELPVMADAALVGSVSQNHDYRTANEAAIDTLANFYRTFYQETLFDQGWTLTGDSQFDDGSRSLRFRRGPSLVEIYLGEETADQFSHYISMDTYFEQSDTGLQYAYGERSCFDYTEQANDLNTAQTSTASDQSDYVQSKVDEYQSLIQTAIDTKTIALLCAYQEQGEATYNFLIEGTPQKFSLDIASDEETIFWLSLSRINRPTDQPTEFFEYRDRNTLRIINAETAISTDAAQVKARVFSPLIEHLESISDLSGF